MVSLSEIRAVAGAAGGRHPASELQKQIARQTIRTHQPWAKSARARSELGHFLSSRNASPKPGPLHLSRLIDSRKEANFEAECQRVELLVQLIEKTCDDIRGLANPFGIYCSAVVSSSKLLRDFEGGIQFAEFRCKVEVRFVYREIVTDILGLAQRYALEEAARRKLQFNAKKEGLIRLIALAQSPQPAGSGLAEMLAVVAGLETDATTNSSEQ